MSKRELNIPINIPLTSDTEEDTEFDDIYWEDVNEQRR